LQKSVRRLRDGDKIIETLVQQQYTSTFIHLNNDEQIRSGIMPSGIVPIIGITLLRRHAGAAAGRVYDIMCIF